MADPERAEQNSHNCFFTILQHHNRGPHTSNEMCSPCHIFFNYQDITAPPPIRATVVIRARIVLDALVEQPPAVGGEMNR